MRWLARLFDMETPLDTYENDAASWMTCAVGEGNANAPLAVEYNCKAPVDKELDRLGMRFYTNVVKNQRSAALRNYLKIQRRIGQLSGLRMRG